MLSPVSDAERKGLPRRGQGQCAVCAPGLSLLGQRQASCWVLQNSMYQEEGHKNSMPSGDGPFWEQSVGKDGNDGGSEGTGILEKSPRHQTPCQ